MIAGAILKELSWIVPAAMAVPIWGWILWQQMKRSEARHRGRIYSEKRLQVTRAKRQVETAAEQQQPGGRPAGSARPGRG